MTVVADDPEFVDLLRDIFPGPLEVVAASPASANSVADSQPDLLFVKLYPVDGGNLSGWDLTALARQHKDLCQVPIILCTADKIALDVDGERLAAFSDVYLLAKPFDLETIEQLVGRLLPRERVDDRRGPTGIGTTRGG